MVENTFVLKLSDGSDILEGLQTLIKENGIDYGLLVNGVGKIKEFELLSTGPKGRIERMKSNDEFQLNAMSGKLQLLPSGKVNSYLRVSITKTGFTPKAGQLIKGKAAGSLEIGLRKIDMKKIIEA